MCSPCCQATTPAQQNTAWPALCVGDTTLACILDKLDVLEKRALLNLERRRLPLRATGFELMRGNSEFDGVLHRIDGNDVPVTHKGDRSTNLGLRDDMPDAEPMGSARRPAEVQTNTGEGDGKGMRTANQDQRTVRQRAVKEHYPPLKRPSVRHATSLPSPAPMIRLVGLSISGMPIISSPQRRDRGSRGQITQPYKFNETARTRATLRAKVPKDDHSLLALLDRTCLDCLDELVL